MPATALAALPPLVTPSSNDLIGLLPELILGGAFVLLMVLDVFLPAPRRIWLAVFAFVALAAAFGATMWGWFDAGSGRTLYYGAFAYDRFSMFVNAILLISAALVVIISPQYLNRRGIHHGEYYALILAATTGMMILAGALNLMVIFLGIELLSISLYILSGFSRGEERSQEAAMKYLLLGGFASGFLLYGMALVYGETGHTQLVQIGLALRAAQNVDPLVLVGVILVFIGFAFKTSSAPFHAWTPDVYQGAPTSVTMFMSVATKVAAFAALVRVFTYTFPQVYTHWQVIVSLVAILSMLVGNIAALTQTSLKRMLAYSGVAQAGYILIGVIAGGQSGLSAVLYYLFVYMFMNFGAFAVITLLAGPDGDRDRFSDLEGLAKRNPVMAVLMSVFMLSLAGFPPSVGFFGKLFLFTAGVSAGYTWLVVLAVIMSVVSVFYYVRVLLPVWSTSTRTDKVPTSISSQGVLWLSGVASVALGVYPTTVLLLGQLGANPISGP